MTTPAARAAMALAERADAEGRISTHTARPVVRVAPPALVPGDRIGPGRRGKFGVVVNGKHYKNVRSARTELRVGYEKFYEMLNDGRAHYAKGKQ